MNCSLKRDETFLQYVEDFMHQLLQYFFLFPKGKDSGFGFLKSWQEAVVYQLCLPVFMLWDEFDGHSSQFCPISHHLTVSHTHTHLLYLFIVVVCLPYPPSLYLIGITNLHLPIIFLFECTCINSLCKEMSQGAFLDCFHTCIVLTWYILSLFWWGWDKFSCPINY